MKFEIQNENARKWNTIILDMFNWNHRGPPHRKSLPEAVATLNTHYTTQRKHINLPKTNPQSISSKSTPRFLTEMQASRGHKHLYMKLILTFSESKP